MRLRDRDEPLDPGVERDLDAVDRALAGREVEPDLAGWAELTALLAEERPEPAPGWSEELDRRMAAGFRSESGSASWTKLLDRFRGVRPIRVLAPAGALATLAVIAVAGISSLETGGDDESLSSNSTGGDAPAAVSGDVDQGGDVAAESSAAAPEALGGSLESLDSGYARRDDKVAPGTTDRKVERDVSLVLTTQPDDVRSTTDEAIAITRSLGGIVLSSQVGERGREARATLELTIPTRNLDAALDRLTALANVRSLNESALDITKSFVSAEDRLEDAEARRQELLEALGNADTAIEAEAIQIQIDDARAEIADAEAAFESVARRARLSDLSLVIEGDPAADDRDDEGGLSGWLDDAVTVLEDVVGVLLIAAAIIIPIGLIVGIVWFAVATLRRRRREAALDG